jgi:hypothetical protein
MYRSLERALYALEPGAFTADNLTPERIAAFPKLIVDKGVLTNDQLTNPFTAQPIRPESSPGNFNIRVINGKAYLCTYDQNGIEMRTAFP